MGIILSIYITNIYIYMYNTEICSTSKNLQVINRTNNIYNNNIYNNNINRCERQHNLLYINTYYCFNCNTYIDDKKIIYCAYDKQFCNYKCRENYIKI